MLDLGQASFPYGVQYLVVGGFEIISLFHSLLHHAAHVIQHVIHKSIVGQAKPDQVAADAIVIVVNNSGNHFRQGWVKARGLAYEQNQKTHPLSALSMFAPYP